MKVRATLVIVAGIVSLSTLASGDGVSFKSRDWSMLEPVLENNQVAAISHKDGIEKMALAINIDLDDDEQAVWVVPVPGDPSEVKIDILDGFPAFDGSDPTQKARDNIYFMMLLIRATQLYPLAFECIFTPIYLSIDRDISRFGEIEKYGVHSEILQASNMNSLNAYLTEQTGTTVAQDFTSLEPYMNESHCLIVTWISSRQEFLKQYPEYGANTSILRRDWPSLFVQFPAERAFYPLRPTRAYGDSKTPFKLYVTGYVKPEGSKPLLNQLKLDYFQRVAIGSDEVSAFTKGLEGESIPYTRIQYKGAANLFSEDLTFAPAYPFRLRYADIVTKLTASWSFYPLVLLGVVVISYLSAGITGLILYRRWKGFARLGFANLLTIAGLSNVARIQSGDIGELLRQKRFAGFPFVFSVVFVILTVLLQYILQFPTTH